ncbi:MAG: T9SS type A sorting domain-containing protein [Bacteroidales bacterium]|nr:T9SS type A sorting domain-containing protein [Bacteroidales bacterium]
MTIYVQDQNVRLTEVELFDINGRRLRTMSAVSQQLRISIDNLANGMYFVKIFCGA